VFAKVDPVVVAAILAFLALVLVVPAQASASLRFTLKELLSVAPFLLLSIGVTAYAKASGADNLIARAFRGHFTPDHHFGFEAAAWYWHFVDVVWLLLFVLVYWL